MSNSATKEEVAACHLSGEPHPDGQPWGKCCGTKKDTSCMCLMRKPRDEKSRGDVLMGMDGGWRTLDDLIKTGGRFFCVHRTTTDGYYRECAGWAARFTKNGHSK